MILKLTNLSPEKYAYVNDKNIIYFEPREYNNTNYTYIQCTDDIAFEVKEQSEQIRYCINSQTQMVYDQYTTSSNNGTSGTCGTGGIDAIEHGKYINNSGLSDVSGKLK